MNKIFTLLFTLLFFNHIIAQQVLTQFNFNSGNDNNVTTGTLSPATGTGSFALLGGITSIFKAGHPNSTNDNTGLYTYNYPAQATNSATSGIEASVSTAGKSTISITWWQYHTGQSSKYVRFDYSTDGGATWVTPDFKQINLTGTTGSVDTAHNVFLAPQSNVWYYRALDLSNIININNNANFRFRVISVFAPDSTRYVATIGAYAPVGTWAFDDVTVNENSSLPVTLSNFIAYLNNHFTELSWQTYTEINFSHFVIEESADAIQFTEIGKLTSSHQNNGASYTFETPSKSYAITYYRLKMVDNDGKFNYSKIVAVNRNLPPVLSFSPNPVKSFLTLTHSQAAEKALIQIVSPDGRKLKQYNVETGAVQTSFDVSNLNKGLYFVIYQNGNYKKALKMMKE